MQRLCGHLGVHSRLFAGAASDDREVCRFGARSALRWSRPRLPLASRLRPAGLRVVSPLRRSITAASLFAACGKFAAWLDLFMTPWWRDSNSWSRRLQEPRDPYRLARHCSLRRRGRLRRRRNRRFESPFLRRRVYPHWCLQREESTSRPGQTLRQDAARRALIPGIISRSERRPG